MNNITGIVITKNEEEMIRECLKSLSFCDEILVIDNQSSDKTISVASSLNAKVYQEAFDDFSAQRNYGLSKAEGSWILYIDADERISDELRDEIIETVKNYKEDSGIGGYFIKRKTYFLGKDWGYLDKVQKLFYKKKLIGWEGKLHETPRISGSFSELKHSILHFTHRNLTTMVEKTNKWSDHEASLRYSSHHPPVAWWRFIRVMLTGFMKSYVFERGYKNGTAGVIESVFQTFSMFITYAKLWELQKKSK